MAMAMARAVQVVLTAVGSPRRLDAHGLHVGGAGSRHRAGGRRPRNGLGLPGPISTDCAKYKIDSSYHLPASVTDGARYPPMGSALTEAIRAEKIEVLVTGVRDARAFAWRAPASAAALADAAHVEVTILQRKGLSNASGVAEEPVVDATAPRSRHDNDEAAKGELARIVQPVLGVETAKERNLVGSVVHLLHSVERHRENVGSWRRRRRQAASQPREAGEARNEAIKLIIMSLSRSLVGKDVKRERQLSAEVSFRGSSRVSDRLRELPLRCDAMRLTGEIIIDAADGRWLREHAPAIEGDVFDARDHVAMCLPATFLASIYT